MNVREIINGSAARFLTVPPLVGIRLFGIHLVRALEDRYGFLISPKSVEEFDLQKGIVFQKGFLAGKHTISRVEFYNNGIRAESLEGTDVAEKFIDDVIDWLTAEAGVVVGEQGLRIYNSALELEMSLDFAKNFSLMSEIGRTIGKFVHKYGGPENAYEATGLIMWSHLQNQGPAQFRIERRVDNPFSANVFYSSAPLSTPDHLSVLSDIEKLMA